MEPCDSDDICQNLAKYVLLVQAVVLAMIIVVNISNLVWRQFSIYQMPDQAVHLPDNGDNSKKYRAVPSKVCINNRRRTKPSECPRKHKVVPITLKIEKCHTMCARMQRDNGTGCTVANEQRAMVPEHSTDEESHFHHRAIHQDRVGRSNSGLFNKTINDRMKCSSRKLAMHKLYQPCSSSLTNPQDLKSTMNEPKPCSFIGNSNQQPEKDESQPMTQTACPEPTPPECLCPRPHDHQSDERPSKELLIPRPQIVQSGPGAQKDQSDARPPVGGYCSRSNYRPSMEFPEPRPSIPESYHSIAKGSPDPRPTREYPNSRLKMEQTSTIFKLSRSPLGTEHTKPPVKLSAIPSHVISDSGHDSVINKTDSKTTSSACHSKLSLDKSTSGMGHVVYDARTHRKHYTQLDEAKRYQRSRQDEAAKSPSLNTSSFFSRASCSSEKGIDATQAPT